MTSYPPPPPTGAEPPYGVPAAPYGAPAAPAPPPAGPDTSQAVNAPGVAWLVPCAALLALVGVFTPWFKAKGTLSGDGKTTHLTFDGLYSFKDGKLGLLAPILLLILAIGVVGLLVGKAPARFSRGSGHPVAYAGKASIIVGAVSLVCVVIAWFLVKSQYKFKVDGISYSWDNFIKNAKEAGYKLELSRNPQIGYFLTIAAAVLAIVAGVLMILAARSASQASGPSASAALGTGNGGYQPAGGDYAPAPGGYPQSGTTSQDSPPYR